MKATIRVRVNSKTKEAKAKVHKAAEESLKDVIIAVQRDAKAGSPVLTGNNARKIDLECSGLKGSVFSTSGYGGYLEVGTSKMPARPYFRPAVDKNIGRLPAGMKARIK